MMKRQMTPLGKGGTRTVHAGKGSRQGPMNARAAITAPGQAPPTMNNYAKAAPTAPAPAPPPGLGSGVFPGISGAPQ
jgi:hypothetical protein